MARTDKLARSSRETVSTGNADYRRNRYARWVSGRVAGPVLVVVGACLAMLAGGVSPASADTVGGTRWHYYTFPDYDNVTSDPGGNRLAYPAVVLANGTSDGQTVTVPRYYAAESPSGAEISYPLNGKSHTLVWESANSRWVHQSYADSTDPLPSGLGLVGSGYVLLCEDMASSGCADLRADNPDLPGDPYTGAAWASLLGSGAPSGLASAFGVTTSAVSGSDLQAVGVVAVSLGFLVFGMGLALVLIRRRTRA